MQDLVKVRYDVDSGHYHESSNLLSYPEKWDWRTKGLVTDVSSVSYLTSVEILLGCKI